jgi:hypothetical protein
VLGYWATAPTAHASRAPSGRRTHAPWQATRAGAPGWGMVRADMMKVSDEVIRENPASRGTETSAEVLVGPPCK